MKKILTIFLVFLLSLCAVSAFACSGGKETPSEPKKPEEETPQEVVIEETRITDGFTKNKNANEYFIHSANGLSAFNVYFNGGFRDFSGATAYLKADIEFFDDWTSLDLSQNRFNGFTFDGNGHTVSGLRLVPTEKAYFNNNPVGFFGIVDKNNLTVKNVTFKNVTLSPTTEYVKWAGVVVGYHRECALNIENVKVEDSTILPFDLTSKKIGAIMGFGNTDTNGYKVTIKNCAVKNCTLSGMTSTAGIAGTLLDCYALLSSGDPKVTIENCSVTGCSFSVTRAPVGALVVDEDNADISGEQFEELLITHGLVATDNEIKIK